MGVPALLGKAPQLCLKTQIDVQSQRTGMQEVSKYACNILANVAESRKLDGLTKLVSLADVACHANTELHPCFNISHTTNKDLGATLYFLKV